MHLRKLAVLALLMMSASVLVGCAGGGQVKVDPQAMVDVKNIAMLKPGAPPKYSLEDYGNPLGPIAGAINTSSKNDRLNELLSDARFDYRSEMQKQLELHLTGNGMKIVRVDAPRENPLLLKASYKDVNAGDADAVMDVAARIVGYASKTITDSAYRPYILLSVRLTKSKTGEVLYQEDFLYGYENPFIRGTELPAPKEHYFSTFDLMIEKKTDVVAGLRRGIDELARTVAERLSSRQGT